MTPFFNPGPISHPDIPIYIAGVNTGLARLAGEVADGFHVHPFHTPRYLREVLLPAIHQGVQKVSRTQSDVKISVTVFTASTPEEADFARMQIAFYASTPSYRRVFDLHGWNEVSKQLSSSVVKLPPEQLADTMVSFTVERGMLRGIQRLQRSALKKIPSSGKSLQRELSLTTDSL